MIPCTYSDPFFLDFKHRNRLTLSMQSSEDFAFFMMKEACEKRTTNILDIPNPLVISKCE